jgi:GGDEF domain-containing protein
MAERSVTVMNTLLGLHREQDPQGLLRYLLTQLAPEYGRAVACCYLHDPATDEFRLELMNDAAGEATRRLWRADLRAPLALTQEAAGPVLAQLAASGSPVQVSESLPDVLIELWGEELARAIQGLLEMRFATAAPILTDEGVAGLLAVFFVDAWPFEVAAECTAHAAAALGNIVGRRTITPSAERDPETGLHTRRYAEQAGIREINRAERYRRALSLAVVEPKDPTAADARLRALAAHVTRVMRQPDTAGRLERQRLVVILPETLAGGAHAFLRRLSDMAGPDVPALRGRSATFPQDGRTWDELVAKAVERLDHPEMPAIPGASLRGGLRSAFPNFTGGNPTGGDAERSPSRWR